MLKQSIKKSRILTANPSKNRNLSASFYSSNNPRQHSQKESRRGRSKILIHKMGGEFKGVLDANSSVEEVKGIFDLDRKGTGKKKS